MVASAMTLLAHADGEPGVSYLELAEFLANFGARGRIEADLEQLFRRIVFNVLVANRDDHLRNHAFLFEETGWRLAPAYDMNPSLAKAEHALLLDEASPMPGIAPVLATCEYYRLGRSRAEALVQEVREAVSGWRSLAAGLGLPNDEIRRVAGTINPGMA